MAARRVIHIPRARSIHGEGGSGGWIIVRVGVGRGGYVEDCGAETGTAGG